MIGVNGMTNLEWVFLITFIGALIALLSAVTMLAFFVVFQKKFKIASTTKTRNKSKKKKLKKEAKQLKKTKKRFLISFIVFLFLSLGFGGGATYTSYYQSVNLSEKDSESVVQAYYLIEDFDKQLVLAKSGKNNREKTVNKISELAGKMASFGVLKASYLNKEDGQIKLNRYYNIVKEIGINASSQSQDFYENEELIESFQNDVKKAKAYQKEVFKFYKVDEKSLAKEI